MLPRREFLGSLAASFVVTGSTVANSPFSLKLASSSEASPGLPAIEAPDLKWKSVVIETQPHNDAYRSPVITQVDAQTHGNLIAVVGDDHVVSLFDRESLAFVEHVRRHRDWVRCCQFSPDGQLLATAGNDRMLYLWGVNRWDSPLLMKRHNNAIIDLAFSPDSQQIAVVGFGPQATIFNVANGRLIKEISTPCPDTHAVVYSLDGGMLAAGGRSGQIGVWETSTWKQISLFQAHRQRIRTLEFTPGNELISAGEDQFVRITNPQAPQQSKSLPRMAARLFCTTLLEDDLLATGGSDNLIRVWQLSNLQKVGTLFGHTGTVTSLNYSQHQLISGSYDTRIRIWTTQQHTVIQQRTTDLNQQWNPALK